MDARDETTSKSATAHEEEGTSNSQFPDLRGRSKSPPWRKVLVYDCAEQALEVQNEKDIS